MARKMKFAARNYLGLVTTALAFTLVLLSASGAGAQSSSDKPDQGQSQAASNATQSVAKPNLAGTWKLNTEQSDDARQKMRDAMGAPNGQGGQGQGGERPRQGAARPGRGNGPRSGMMAEWNQLNIDQSDNSIKVSGASGRLLATSQPESKTENNDKGEMRFPPASAQWQGSQLIAKSQGFGGGTTTRTFELSPDGNHLNVTTKIESERFSQPVTFKFVYDKGTPDSK